MAEGKSKRIVIRSPPNKEEVSIEELEKLKEKLLQGIKKSEEARVIQSQVLLDRYIVGRENTKPSDIDDLLNIAGNLTIDTKAESLHSLETCYKKSSFFSGCCISRCVSKTLKLTPQFSKIKAWLVEIIPHEKYPNIKVCMKYETLDVKDSEELPEITKFKVKVTGLEVDNDLAEVIKFCQNDNEIQLVSQLMQSYIPHFFKRRMLLEEMRTHSFCDFPTESSIRFKDDEDQFFAEVATRISLDYSSFSWSISWSVSLSDQGAFDCTRLNLPSGLMQQGVVQEWSLRELLSKLRNVAEDVRQKPDDIRERLEQLSSKPTKENATETNTNTASEDRITRSKKHMSDTASSTPKGMPAIHKIPKKRKINL